MCIRDRDTTEVQLTTDGVENFSYAREEEAGENGEVDVYKRQVYSWAFRNRGERA